MRASDNLFRLIKAMSGSEKRHFSIFASRHVMGDQNIYLKVFRAIDKQTVYDEEALKMQFKGAQFLKQFSVVKDYLYNLILKGLRNYYSSNNVEFKLQACLQNIIIIHEKGLHENALKQIKNGMRLAIINELFLYTIQFAKWHKKILLEKDGFTTNKELIDLNKEINRSILQERTEFNNALLKESIFYHIHKANNVRQMEELKGVEKTISKMILEEEKASKSDSLKSKELLYHGLSSYYYFIRDYKNFYQYCSKYYSIAKLIYKRTKYQMSYIKALNNLGVASVLYNKIDEYKICLDNLKNCKGKTDIENINIYFRRINLEMLFFTKTKQFDLADILIKNEEKKLLDIAPSIIPGGLISIYFHFGLVKFYNKQYKESLKWFNKIFNEDWAVREDIQTAARVLNLIVHYELGNQMLLEHMIRSTYRWIFKKQRLYKFEIMIFDFLKKNIMKAKNREDFTLAFDKLKSDLTNLLHDPFERDIIEYSNLIPWLEEKLSKR